jgi:hypothetical protein
MCTEDGCGTRLFAKKWVAAGLCRKHAEQKAK